MHRLQDFAASFDELDDRTSYKTLFALIALTWVVAVVVGDAIVLVYGWFLVAIPFTIMAAVFRNLWHRHRQGRSDSPYDPSSTRRT